MKLQKIEVDRPAVAVVAASLEILGGQGVQASSLTRALREEGCDARFLAINPAFPRGLRRLRELPYVRTILNQALYLPGLARLASVDVAHVFSASYASFLLAPVPAMLVARLMNKRVVLHYHSGEAEDHLEHWGWLVHPWLGLADEIVVPSRYLKDAFARFGHETRVIPNVVDVSRFRYRARSPLRPRLLSTRNLERYYRVDTIIEAFARFQALDPSATLTIAGIGSEEVTLRALAASITRGGVQFVGRVEPERMPDLCSQADVFLNASEVDNQPVSILEAFASGLPVISTPAGDISSLVRADETGRLVPPADPAAMADAIAETLRRPDRALQMAERARAEVNRFTWAAVRDDWFSVYAGEPSRRAPRSLPLHPIGDGGE
jgi:glycosyltransferase involved in cell wall biosynthesis